MVDSPHGKGVTFTIRSRPVGYAAEHLTCGEFSALTMGFSLLMFMRILYHVWKYNGVNTMGSDPMVKKSLFIFGMP